MTSWRDIRFLHKRVMLRSCLNKSLEMGMVAAQPVSPTFHSTWRSSHPSDVDALTVVNEIALSFAYACH